MEARVGRAFTLILLFTVTFVIWVGETRMLFRATLRELISVSRETAVNPFGARMLAKWK